VPLNGLAGWLKDNYDLSALRATSAFRELIETQPVLTQFLTGEHGTPILSVSGYGPDRPSVPNVLNKNEPRNRRIEFRMIMQTPVSSTVEAIQQRIRELPQHE
jgi:flagellar motor protein MotB